jgi:hypothetical protein
MTAVTHATSINWVRRHSVVDDSTGRRVARTGLQCPCLGGTTPRFSFMSGTPRVMAGVPSMSQDVRHRQVVPSTTLAHFNHIDAEFPIFARHLGELLGGLHSTGITPQLVTIDIGHMGESGPPTHRTRGRRRLPVILRRAQEIGVCVAGVSARQSAGEQPHERGATRESVVDDRPGRRLASVDREARQAPGRHASRVRRNPRSDSETGSCPGTLIGGADSTAVRPLLPVRPNPQVGRRLSDSPHMPTRTAADLTDLCGKQRVYILKMYRVDTSSRHTRGVNDLGPRFHRARTRGARPSA